MQIAIDFEDMKWVALAPELILLFVALSILLMGLSKTLNTNKFLSKVSLAGVAAALAASFVLWDLSPSAGNGGNPEIFGRALLHDHFSQSFNILFLAMSLFPILSSFRYPGPNHENKAEYFSLVLMTVVGMMFLAGAGNMITAFVALEMFSFSLYILCGFSAKHGTGREGPDDIKELDWECRSSQESAIKYFLTGAFASAILVYGMALIYAGTGTTELRLIGQLINENPYSKNLLVYVGMGLLFSGMAFKISLAPFHAWTPDVYHGAPTPITAFMSVATKAAAFAFIARVFYVSLSEMQEVWFPFLFGISALTMLVGNTAAIFQNNMKRMLAYSGVAHAGYFLIGIVTNTGDGIAGILFYMGAYLFMNVGAFAVIYILEGEGEGAGSIDRFKGLGKRNPLLAATMSLFMISLAGFPPTAGFFGKLYLFVAAIKQGYALIAILAVTASMIAVYFYLRVVALMYFHEGEEEGTVQVNRGMGSLVAVSSLAIILIGIYPSQFMRLALDSIPF
ncbi:MAG: NADH-quinone oxidoreductase subunit N [Nitrospinales bacterium]